MIEAGRPAPGAIVFDLDGTLVDSRRDIANAASVALAAHGLPPRSEAEIAGYVGDGARVLLARCASWSLDAPGLDALLATFLDSYAAHALDHTRLMPGALGALDALGELPLAVCTNKPRRTAELVLGGLQLTQRFAFVVAGDDLTQRKPHPAPLLQLAHSLGLPASSLVMVGDGPQDVECGRAAGARTVGVEGGLLPRARLLASQPDVMIASLVELPAVVRRWSDRAGALS